MPRAAIPPLFWTWQSMVRRCHNPKDKSFYKYGARGIRVCERWRHSFVAFCNDMGPRPSSKHSVDRVDNDGNYEPGNCRWATAKEQTRNGRHNRLLRFEGRTMCASELAELIGIRAPIVIQRMNMGWSVKRIVSTPVRPKRKNKKSLDPTEVESRP